jgi:CheY-like chemotaxis protein
MKQALLVDDNPAQLGIRELVLRKGGVDSHVATSAHAALALLRSTAGREKIGVVITDHFMPNMDGVEFVRQLRQFAPGLPVILISGQPDADSEYAGLNITFRCKPCEPDDLISLVRQALSECPHRATA